MLNLTGGTKIDITVLSSALCHLAIRKTSQTEEAYNDTLARFTNRQSTFAQSHNANAISEDSDGNTT
jgi:hypothetical protein